MISFEPDRPRRRWDLTPMIDVVFLLLIFFMLASRFGVERSLAVVAPVGGGAYSGPPRLVEVAPTALYLNGVAIPAADLPAALSGLMQSPDDTVILRPRDGATVQTLVDVLAGLSQAGMTRLVLLE